jgi:hypothetical protein
MTLWNPDPQTVIRVQLSNNNAVAIRFTLVHQLQNQLTEHRPPCLGTALGGRHTIDWVERNKIAAILDNSKSIDSKYHLFFHTRYFRSLLAICLLLLGPFSFRPPLALIFAELRDKTAPKPFRNGVTKGKTLEVLHAFLPHLLGLNKGVPELGGDCEGVKVSRNGTLMHFTLTIYSL